MKTAIRDVRFPLMRKHAMCVATVGLMTLSILTGLTFQSPTRAKANAIGEIALGADIDDSSVGGSGSCSAGVLANYTALVGRMPAVVMWYQEWGEAYPDFSARCMNYVYNGGATGMITWEPWAGNASDPAYKLTNIINGNFDAYIQQYALDAKAWGHPFFLRFAHEMNGNWYPWGTAPGNANGNTAADYVAAWQHVHDIFTRVGATNAVWVWSPNELNPGALPTLVSLYPGDAYVDWVGLDGYNDGTDTNAGYSGWQTFTQMFGYSYDTLAALTQKPMMIAETGSAEQSNNPTTRNKAAWISSAFFNEIPVRFPRLQLIDWFDRNKETDWRVNSSAASLGAYQAVVASPLYQGRITSAGVVTSLTLS